MEGAHGQARVPLVTVGLAVPGARVREALGLSGIVGVLAHR